MLKESTSSYKDTKSKSRIYVNPYVRELFVTVLERICVLTTHANTTTAERKSPADAEDLKYKITTLQTEVVGLQQVKGLLNQRINKLTAQNRKLQKQMLEMVSYQHEPVSPGRGAESYGDQAAAHAEPAPAAPQHKITEVG